MHQQPYELVLEEDDGIQPARESVDEGAAEGKPGEAGKAHEAEDAAGNQVPGAPAGGAQAAALEVQPEIPAAQRIAKLLDEMPGQRRVLMGIVEFCREARTAKEVDARVTELKSHAFSVYEPVTLRELLESAGALAYEGEDREGGEDADEVHTETVSVSDEEYAMGFLEVAPTQPGVWRATEEGLEAVAENADAVRTVQLLADEPQYRDVYLAMIAAVADGHAHTAKEMDERFNDLPQLQQPRRYAGFFTSHLEKCGAIEWAGGWVATEAGRALVAEEGACHE